jgi:hypothetical protein
MNDVDFKRELADRRARLVKESNRILDQIKACDALLQTLGEPQDQTHMPFVRLEESPKHGRVSVSDMVDSAILSLPKELSLADIMDCIRMKYSAEMPDKKTVASTFWKTAKARNFKIVQKGHGRKPTIYSKT